MVLHTESVSIKQISSISTIIRQSLFFKRFLKVLKSFTIVDVAIHNVHSETSGIIPPQKQLSKRRRFGNPI